MSDSAHRTSQRMPVGAAEVIDINRRRLQRLERSLGRTRERLAHVEARCIRAMIETRRLQLELRQGMRELETLRRFLKTGQLKAGIDAGPVGGNDGRRGVRRPWWFGRRP